MMDAPEDLPDARPLARDGSPAEDSPSRPAIAGPDGTRIAELAARSAGRYFRPGESEQPTSRDWRAGRIEPLAGRHRERGRGRPGRRWRHPA